MLPGASAAAGPVPDTVVDLTLAERFSADAGSGRWRTALLRTFDALRHCYAEWSQETSARRLTYLAVTYQGGGMGYHPDDDIAQPLGGLWAGLAKTLHRELPNCRVRILDIALDARVGLPELVGDELGRPGLSEIGHRDGLRWTLTPDAVPAGPPAVRLGPDDTVLISGGSRGIGMALARRLCAEFGPRVVVTGRGRLPAEDTWDDHTPERLAEHRAALWATHRQGRAVADIRRDIGRAESTWELVGHLRSARAEGLRLDYRQCDFTDTDQVRELVAELPGLTVVVHNAGVDRPTRLPNKSDDDVVAVVATKVDSFVHLVRAVRDRPLKLLCTVGSLTGRLGGMVGQFDYAAANECLARLGLWAGRQLPYPVMTLAWPTWARLGLISNFEASLRYMAALDVFEGLDHWQAELLAGSRGEITFVGPLGRALDPVQAVGYPVPPSLPGYAETYPKVFHLGEPEVFQPHERLCCMVTFDPATSPAIGDFTVHGAPAVPLGMLLESAVRGAEWVTPADLPDHALHAVEGLRVPWSVLRCADGGGPLRLRRDIRARQSPDGRWQVDVTFRRAGPAGATTAGETGADDVDTARLRLVFGAPAARRPPPHRTPRPRANARRPRAAPTPPAPPCSPPRPCSIGTEWWCRWRAGAPTAGTGSSPRRAAARHPTCGWCRSRPRAWCRSPRSRTSFARSPNAPPDCPSPTNR
ncbi:SDR family NAD(P)-dependent oxidoreductase [Streptomyces sp. HUAS TT20]|uniref:SDR family NAD(P)-dependent oxidoreductase n=1 Tax=Streptomyces sp. HUAS TT20 TaxID=3447509 RepID=UPI0021DA5431|nr:SDR family NAD(P)-dependent oxidoreductase [Streptomyces sp. HUAS 15-9]UXY30478.1 SDR family NAD(P)-dependent oxidoreductase [Streptomyces sp. HUAS 15-9]